MSDYSNYQHHPLSEKLVNAICERVGTTEKSFFRVHVAYYLSVVAASMQARILMPNNTYQSINFYGLNLAPSGFGKGYSTHLLEDYVVNEFVENFTEHTFSVASELNLPQIAIKRAARKNLDYDDVLKKLEAEYARLGPYVSSFDAATTPAVEQLRNKILMAKLGSINLQIDEIGSNLTSNTDALNMFLELFDGTTKNKLIKNTNDSLRGEELKGVTPTNMMLFGVPNSLLDGGKTQEQFLHFISTGYGRRCFFSFIPEDYEEQLDILTPEEQYELIDKGTSTDTFEELSNYLGNFANIINASKTILLPKDTSLLFFQYKNDCLLRAKKITSNSELIKIELKQRYYKALKLAGVYAFIDQSPEVTVQHLENAILLAENSGEAFNNIINREEGYVRLAKYLSRSIEDLTRVDLLEQLPSFKGTKQQQDELITRAVEWGYKNSVVIKKSYINGIEFLKGETLTATNLDKIRVSYSRDIVNNYLNEEVPFNKLYQLTQSSGYHWTNHLLISGYRNDESCIPGFNAVVIDVDTDISLSTAKDLLKEYKALYYTTKRHTPENNRFRIILPTNYTLNLDKEDFKQFMRNVFEWLPFTSDEETGQRSRKWLSHQNHYEYTDGKLLDVLPFIPRTSKNEERKRQFTDLQSLNNLERWFIQNTGNGNRNNQLLKYALVLVDNGYTYEQIQESVLTLNDKLADKLDVLDICKTIMVTVKKRIEERVNS